MAMRRLFTFTPIDDGAPLARIVRWLNQRFSNLVVALGQPHSWVNKTAAYTASGEDEYIYADATGAPFTVTIPAATAVPGLLLTIKNTTAGANLVTVGATVDGVVSPTLAAKKAMTIASDGTVWNTVAVV